ncbi:unnamed protein product [Rotaria magnacalcarata]|uniref:Transglutaminase-like domain-containing protein n=1 Tax=Rotaria magnacalcarata TaxID=392030 RepID=A0A818X1K4_9BILA|nr:unnamed protein product [Rotaria magnacalcarata]CAF2066114.1 unnamed protein product [Rotaria magnacalcarata]CAF3733067.1 unnamed protein product [Rotaria magnacalcarata]CAF3861927.1 unnamed protein product [Rotaria magnacalcarata]
MSRKQLTTGAAAFAPESNFGRTNAEAANKSFHLIWLADEVHELKTKFSQAFNYLQSIFASVDFFSESDLFVNFLYEMNNKKIVLIVSGGLGKNTVPAVHDATELDSIFIFCHNRAHHEQWAKAYMKVKGVFNEIDDLCQAVGQSKQNADLSSSRTTPVPSRDSSAVHRSLTPQPPPGSNLHARRTVIDSQKPQASGLRAKDDKDSVETTTIVDNQREKHHRHSKRTPSPLILVEKDDHRDSSLINSTKSTPTSRSSSNYEQLERALVETTEQTLRNSLLGNNDIHQATSLQADAIDRLHDTFLQTIQKQVTKKSDESTELKHLFTDLKQALVDAVIQQQSALVRDVIKQTVVDALKHQQNSAHAPSLPSTTTTTKGIQQRKPIVIINNREIKIAADIKKTRIDANFRRKREAVVSNKRLRDVVQQWTAIQSVADLAVTIKKYGTNDLECAWLLFCWVGQNIQYKPYCNNNSADTVFRTKQGVCRGFASLYHECCSLLGIECSEISGYAKQTFVKSGAELQQSLHAWNSVILDQYTYLIDPTWGAGGRDNKNKLEDFYFLTSPEEFIYTHYAHGYQLLEPEITKEEFISLPVMKSTYHQLGLALLSPKQGLNETNQNIFKIAIQAPAHIDLFAALKVGDVEYPRSLHTLCQRDQNKADIYNCYITPPLDGLYEVTIFAKTNDETTYFDAINMRLRVSNINDAFMFPITYATFTEHRCILIEPFQRLLCENEQVLIHMIIPNANVIKIRNGDEYMVPHKDEYKNGVLKKQICVQGDLQVCGRWDDKADSISIICIFNMI